MDLQNERKLAARAKILGETADAGVLPELGRLIVSESALVRRLAASALGKLAGIVDLIEMHILESFRASAPWIGGNY